MPRRKLASVSTNEFMLIARQRFMRKCKAFSNDTDRIIKDMFPGIALPTYLPKLFIKELFVVLCHLPALQGCD